MRENILFSSRLFSFNLFVQAVLAVAISSIKFNYLTIMYDPRYSPAYQIPYQPLYDATRLEIQRSIFTLEEKFRRRKEIDLELTARPLLPTPILEYQQNYYERLRSIQGQERMLANMSKEADYQCKLAQQAQHLKRIEMLKRQRDLLHRQNQYKREVYETPFAKIYNQEENVDDDELIKKYENGSKAKQYYKDLELQNQRKKEHEEAQEREANLRQKQDKERQNRLDKRLANEKANRQIQFKTQNNLNGAYSDRKEVDHKKDIYDTPYDIIRPYPNTTKKDDFKRSPLVQQLEKEFNKIDEQKEHNLTSKFANTMKDKPNSPLRYLQQSNKPPAKATSPHKAINKYQSLGKFAPYRSRSALSPMKKSYNDSYLQSKRLKQVEQHKPSMKEIEINALKKIENRLKVSKVIYEDSQFRNIKYEGNHLYNTFEIESKQRKEIKDKVNSHPFVLKKHALVVD